MPTLPTEVTDTITSAAREATEAAGEGVAQAMGQANDTVTEGMTEGQRAISFNTRRKMALVACVAFLSLGMTVLGFGMFWPGVSPRISEMSFFVSLFFGGLGSIPMAYFGATTLMNARFGR